MSNILKADYYNKDLKESFLDYYKKKGRFESFFKRTSAVEFELGKDVSKFDLPEFEIMFSQWNIEAIAQNRILFRDYIDYVMKTTDSPESNPLSNHAIKERYKDLNSWQNQFTNPIDNYMSKEELLKIEKSEIDRQFAVVFRLLFEGVHLEEILELTIDNIEKNRINLKDRNLIIDDIGYNLIIDAYYEEECTGINRGEKFYVNDGRKIIKKANTNISNEDSKEFLKRRIRIVKDNLKINKNLTPTTISRSGMIYKSKDWFSDNPNYDRLPQAEISKIIRYFGYNNKNAYASLFYVFTRKNYNYLYSDLIDTKVVDKKEFSQFPFWKIREEIGYLGEEIVERELEKQGFEVTHQVATIGFDFIAEKADDIRKIEVKTITNKKGKIYLSINELRTAIIENQEYLLYIILLEDKEKKTGKCYEIKNPIKYFGFKEEKLEQILTDNEFDMGATISVIEIKLNETLFTNAINVF